MKQYTCNISAKYVPLVSHSYTLAFTKQRRAGSFLQYNGDFIKDSHLVDNRRKQNSFTTAPPAKKKQPPNQTKNTPPDTWVEIII